MLPVPSHINYSELPLLAYLQLMLLLLCSTNTVIHMEMVQIFFCLGGYPDNQNNVLKCKSKKMCICISSIPNRSIVANLGLFPRNTVVCQ